MTSLTKSQAIANQVASIEVHFRGKKYLAQAAGRADAPDWLTNYSAPDHLRYTDDVFRIVMTSGDLSNDINDYRANSSSHARIDIVVVSSDGQKAVIKEASVRECYGREITAIGTILRYIEQHQLED